jgi:hypothetical protein
MREVWRANALQEPFFSLPGAGVARAWQRKKDLWGDNVAPNPSLRKVSCNTKSFLPLSSGGTDPEWQKCLFGGASSLQISTFSKLLKIPAQVIEDRPDLAGIALDQDRLGEIDN